MALFDKTKLTDEELEQVSGGYLFNDYGFHGTSAGQGFFEEQPGKGYIL